jgi:hypothetical protein
MTDKTFDPKLWTDRSPEETRALYTDWAATYDADVTGAGYATPRAGRGAGGPCPRPRPRRCSISAAAPGFRAGAERGGLHHARRHRHHARHAGEGRRRSASTASSGPPSPATPRPRATPPSPPSVSSASARPRPARSPRFSTRSPPAAILGFSYNDATLADPAYMEALDAAQARADLLHDAYGPTCRPRTWAPASTSCASAERP